MWKTGFGSVCPVCRSSVLRGQTRAVLSKPWIPLTPLTPLTPTLGQPFSSLRQKKTPSRMVLSKTVARPPPTREGARRRVEGPFSGMNRRVANVRGPAETEGSSSSKNDKNDNNDNKNRFRLDKRPGKRDDRNDRKPRKALRMQQALTQIGYGQRTHVKSKMQEFESFSDFRLLPAVQAAVQTNALQGMTDVKPTPIQRLAIPALLGQVVDTRPSRQEKTPGQGQEFLLAAETGSGKTLAYLLPAIDALKRAEAADVDLQAYQARLAAEKARQDDPHYRGQRGVFEPHPTTARPRVVVLVPSAELVAQVGAVAKGLSHVVKFKTDLLSANVPPRVMQRNLYAPTGIDMVVATPLLLASLAEADPNVLSRVTHLVVDEADSLLDRSFAPATTAILDRARPSLRQLVFCSATIPRRLDSLLASQFPRMQRITTPNLHAIPRRVQLGVIDVTKEPYHHNKNLACADAIWSIGRDRTGNADGHDVKRIMVFVNEREKTMEVAAYLRSKGIDAVALHRDASEHRFSDTLAEFTQTTPSSVSPSVSSPAPSTPSTPSPGRSLPHTKVIVATDLASRGIDTLAVRHVVLYDVPHTTIDFIHRLGRAGRMGRRGHGIALVGKDDRRDVVAEVRESMYMGQALV